MKISTKNAPKHIKKILKAGLVPMLHGSPGTAKSSIYRQLAEVLKLFMIDLRLSQLDPTDMGGFPSIDQFTKKAGYVPMDTFPIQGDKIPEGYNGWLLVLDEFNSASIAVQAAAYKLVLDRQIGQHALHDNVYTVAAGNLATDNAIVNRMSTAMQSRMVHLEIELIAADWIEWALENKLDHRIISFIEFRPDMLHKFDPNHNDFTFPCARTWEFASKQTIDEEVLNQELLPTLAGSVGEGAAREFLTYSMIYGDLPKLNDILNSPDAINISKEPSILYALSGMLSYNATKENFPVMMEFIDRLPLEFQVITMRNALRRNKGLGHVPAWQEWAFKNASELI